MADFHAHSQSGRCGQYRRLDACVVAGPGSGKTTVLVERFRALIQLHRFDPREILAITFTEKAAANMKAKLADLFAHDQNASAIWNPHECRPFTDSALAC